MALPPISVQLTKFEHLVIVRQEIEVREEELHECEKTIRELLTEVERQKYLKTLHPYFRGLPAVADATKLPQLQAKRDELGGALQALKAALNVLERETKGLTPPTGGQGLPSVRPAASPRRAGFESFEDFQHRKG